MTPMQLKALTRQQKVDMLREFRLKPTRNPVAVTVLAADVLASGTGGLGDEVYNVIEQYVISALELGNREQAGKSLATLDKAFGTSSVRVRRLHGLVAESSGDNAKAREIYRSILKDQPADAFAVKRMSVILKAQGQYQDAVDMLESSPVYIDEDKVGHRYLEVHNADEASCRELLNLHYYLRKWEKCMSYAEECILLNPYSYLNHVRHAEVCFIAKEYERSAAAYAHALTLNSGVNNSRAAYGLLTVAKELMKSRNYSNEEAKALHQWATTRLRVLYQGSPMFAVLHVMLQKE